jgi:hypothetical protein
MKKVLFLALALSVICSSNAFAAGQAYLWGGYTTVNMKSFNDWACEAKENMEKNAGGAFKVSKLKDAFIIGADYLCDISETVKIGPRVAFLLAKGKLSGHYHNEMEVEYITYADGQETGRRKEHVNVDGDGDISCDSSLVPIMFGGSYNKNISDKFSLNGKLFFGYGLIKHKLKSDDHRTEAIEATGIKETVRQKSTLDLNGGCFVADMSIGAQHWLTKRLGLGLDLGYRFTPKTELKGKWRNERVARGEEEEDRKKVDFSGLTAKLSLSYKI